MNTLVFVFVNFLPIFIAIIIHEIAHGFVAYLFGDDTAKENGRLSLNPIKHMDIVGSIILPTILILSKIGFVFGWAKPVPVNYKKLSHPRLGGFLVACAGILANLLLAAFCALLLKATSLISQPHTQMIVSLFLVNLVAFNIVLAVFNALPIPPLDGSKILFGWINKPWVIRYINAEKKGFYAIIALFFIIPIIGNKFGLNLNFLGMYIINVSKYLISVLI